MLTQNLNQRKPNYLLFYILFVCRISLTYCIQLITYLYNVLPIFIVSGNSPLIKRKHATTKRINNLLIVRRQNNGRADFVNLFEDFNDLGRGHRIKITGRLISNQEVRLIDNRAGNRDPLPFTARQSREVHFSSQRKIQRVRHIGSNLIVRATGRRHCKGDILVSGFVR